MSNKSILLDLPEETFTNITLRAAKRISVITTWPENDLREILAGYFSPLEQEIKELRDNK